MRSASFLPASDRRRAPLTRRTIAFLLVLAVHVLLILVLITLAPPQPPGTDAPKVFELRQIPNPPAERVPAARAKRATPKASPRASTKPAKAAAARAKPTPASQPFGTELFEAIDIAKLPNYRNERAAAAEGTGAGEGITGTGSDSALAGGPETGPGGEPLYQAEWQREPTHAELAFYLPKSVPPDSWAMIACRTVERFRVEDCQELGDSPPGSGLARSVRQAAWQFRVRPPRVGGHALVGSWVRIRIDFSESGAK